MDTAAELFQHHAFVDLETTGLDPSCDRVIEVGALFVHESKVVRRISKLFASSAPLSVSIRRLTGIDDADLAGQPPFEAFLPELRSALSGWTVVAHNASFEQGFLAELLEEIAAPVLDSCELLHYLYPELQSYSLESMIRWTGIGDRAAHRALKDCEDTWAMLCRSLDRCIEDGRAEDVAEILDSLAPSATGEAQQQTAPPIVDLLTKLAQHCRPADSPSAANCASVSMNGAALDQWKHLGLQPLTLDGVALDRHERLWNGEVEQGPQSEMAAWMERALASQGVSAVEPSRGAARPEACAVGCAAFARKNRCRVTVAANSQGRLARLLGSFLPNPAPVDARRSEAESTGGVLDSGTTRGPLEYAFLAQQRHYLCRRRALEASKTDERMTYEERAPRAYLRAFLRRSPTGELSGLSYWFRGRYPLLERLAFAARSEPATTLATRCPHYGQCFFHSALARAKRAEVLVMPQAVVAESPPGYPQSQYLVIDEGHQLESAISLAMAREVTDVALGRLGDRMLGINERGGLLAALGGELRACVGQNAAAEKVREGALKSQALSLDSERLGGAVRALFPPETTPHRREVLLTEVRGSARWTAVEAALLELKMHLAELAGWLSAQLGALPRLPACNPGLERDIFGAVCEVGRLLQDASEFTSPGEAGRCLFASIDGRPSGWSLRSEPLDVKEEFARLARERSVVLISPALSVGGSSSWILNRLGVAVEHQRVGDGPPAPADRPQSQPLLILISDAPRPFDEEFLDWAAPRICGIAAFLGGRVMGLFSSYLRLLQIEGRLRPHLERSGIEAVMTSQLRRNSARNADYAAGRVLLGGRSLWQRSESETGVACVFIDKLPVEPLSRAVSSAREAMASQKEADGRFRAMPYRLPRALVLLRHWLSTCTAADAGPRVVVVAHPGAAHHRDAVVAALDGYRPEVLPWTAARVRIYEALRSIAARPQSSRLARAVNH